MAGEDTLLQWAGKSAEVFKEQFKDVPKNLKKLKKSYELCGDALADYWPKLERAQALADKALAKAKEAQSDLSSAKSRLSSADSWVTRATKEADKYKDDPTGSKSDADKPDEGKVRAAARDVQSAKSAHTQAQSDVTTAQSALDAAKKMAEDARKMRDDAAGEAKRKIDEASDAGIPNRHWWQDVGHWFEDNWDTIVTVCKVVVAVVGIIAMIIGGPILGATVLVAALVVLADTLYKYSKGQASLWDVAFAALDCIPGGKGITSLGKFAKGLKEMKNLRGGMKAMSLAVRGLGKNARGMLEDGAKGAYNRLKSAIRSKGSDPIDWATGTMFLPETDVTLDRLTSVRTPDGTLWRYRYDPMGRRIAKERLGSDGTTVVERTDFTWDGTTLCEQLTADGSRPHAVAVAWEHDGLRPISQSERLLTASHEEIDARFFAIVTDLVGAPTELVDEDGRLAWQARSTLWGVTSWDGGSSAYTALRFPGQYYDPESGLHYNFRAYGNDLDSRDSLDEVMDALPAAAREGALGTLLASLDARFEAASVPDPEGSLRPWVRPTKEHARLPDRWRRKPLRTPWDD
ncbi:RHS domain-containing protein [Streptomyces sp900105755]|uniref:RHS domain-containing protein n=1 Tax=Streptomyces sp. 900105755 TaxID=3154389 RepID=UPI00331DB86B